MRRSEDGDAVGGVARVAAAVVLLGSAAGGLAAPGEIYNLGTLGGTSSGAAVNEAGQVVGNVTLPDRLHGFLFDAHPARGGAMRDLGTLGGRDSFATGINAAGLVVGSAARATDVSYFRHAFVYDGRSGVMRDLGVAGESESDAADVNDRGQVVGSYTDGTGIHAFLYDGGAGAGGVMHDLGGFGGRYNYAVAINGAGQVTGYSSPPNNDGQYAFRYDGTPGAGGVMRYLGYLGGFPISDGRDVNASGQVAGMSYYNREGDFHAFRYDGTPGQGGRMIDLGAAGRTRSMANAINDAGYVVGAAASAPRYEWTAVLWGPDGTWVDLDAWLDATNPAEGAKWTLMRAEDLTNTGLVTGYGLFNDGPGGESDGVRAYLLDASSLVPEPGTAAVLLAAAAATLCRRNRGRAKHYR